MPHVKHLLKNSWKFYRSNWQSLVLMFLPVELAILASALVLKLGLTPARFAPVALLALVFSIAIMIIKVFKKMLILSSGLFVSEIESGAKVDTKTIYKDIITLSLPIIWVAILEVLLFCAFVCLALVVSLILFFLPFLILGILSRVFPSVIHFFDFGGGAITVGMLVLSLVTFFALCLYFVSRIWFAPYILLLEGRDGIDAIASSLMIGRDKRWGIFWRLVLIWCISFAPILIILGPLFVKIVEEALPQLSVGVLLYFQYHIIPAWPEISNSLFVWRAVLAFVACLVSAPIFVSLNYFLWKDVKACALTFDERHYVKTRKWTKISIWIGAVLAMICIAASRFI